MSALAKGPLYQPTIESIVVDNDYTISYLPDKENDELKKAGEKQVFYYLPQKPRLDQDTEKAYKATLTLFQGTLSEADQVGITGLVESAGGILTLTTDLEIPTEVLQKGNELLVKKLGYDVNIAPVMLESNKIRLDKLTDGTVSPLENFIIQGDGAGATNPGGTNAFTVNLGRVAAEIVQASFKRNTSQIVVRNDISFYLWLPFSKITIKGNWKKIFDHFSTAFSGKAYFFKVDIATQVQSLVTNGTISVQYNFGAGVPEETKAKIRENAQHVLDGFMSQATKLIFEQQPPDVKPAEATAPQSSGGFLGSLLRGWWYDYSAAFSLKKVQITNTLELSYEEEVNEQKLFSSSLSSQMEGIYKEIQKNPGAEEKYIKKIILGQDFYKKRLIKVAANLPGIEKVVTSIECQIGVKNSSGDIQRRPFADGYFDAATDHKGKASMQFLPGSNIAYYLAYDIIPGQDNATVAVINTFRLIDGKIITMKEYLEKTNSINIPLPAYNFIGTLRVPQNYVESEKVLIKVFLRINNSESSYEFDKKTGNEKEINVFSLETPMNCTYKYSVAISGKKLTDNPIQWESDWIENPITGKEQRLSISIKIPDDKIAFVDAYLS